MTNRFLLQFSAWCLSSCSVVAYGICIELCFVEGCFDWIKRESLSGLVGCGRCGFGWLSWLCSGYIFIPVLLGKNGM